jgi:hypothetical protein
VPSPASRGRYSAVAPTNQGIARTLWRFFAARAGKYGSILLRSDAGRRFFSHYAINTRFLHLAEDAERGPWAVTTLGYSYELLDKYEQRIVAYHWHPDLNMPATYPAFPHLHVGRLFAHPSLPPDFRVHASALVRAHLPTARISIESIRRLAIRELGVEPLDERWEHVLEETESDQSRASI